MNQIIEILRKIFQIDNKVESVCVRYECIFVTHGIILRDLDTREYKAFDFNKKMSDREEIRRQVKEMLED